MGNTQYKLAKAANNMAKTQDTKTRNNAVNAMNKYYEENQEKVDCLVNSGMNLMSKDSPINVESANYQFPHQRAFRLANDVNDITFNDNNDNWSIETCQISNDDLHPSILKVSLKFNVLLTVSIDSEYPLTPPKCKLDDNKTSISFADNPCISDNNAIILFDKIWSPSLTLQDIVHFCSIIVQGEDPTSVLNTYVQMHHNSKMQSMLKIIDVPEVKQWLTTIKMKRYYTIFMQNGYNNLKLIQQMSKHDLISIGIYSSEHQKVIMNNIQKLKETNLNNPRSTMKDYLLKYTNPICKCGAEMQQINTKECYVNEYSYVICDGCDVICKKEYGIGKEIVYHCPNKKIQDIHPDGYDVCFECVYKNHLRYRQFNALIISPSLEEENVPIKSKDAETLEMMFKKLGYHNIITLKDDEACKANIKSCIAALYHNEKTANINQVNVIVYTGHGNHFGNEFYFNVADGLLSDATLKEWIYCAENDKNNNDKCEDVVDGYTKCKKALYAVGDNKVRFHRQNTLILINACHSGGFKSLNQIKNNVKKPGILNLAINDIADEMGFDLNTIINTDHKEEEKYDGDNMQSVLKVFDDTLNDVMNEISYNTHSALVISSCKKNETSNYFGQLSPFIEYTLDFFTKCRDEIREKSDEVITCYSQLSDTPTKLYQYIYERGQTPHPETQIVLSDSEWKQNVTVASTRGSAQFVLCPMYR